MGKHGILSPRSSNLAGALLLVFVYFFVLRDRSFVKAQTDPTQIENVVAFHQEYVVDLVSKGIYEFDDNAYRGAYASELSTWKGYDEDGFGMNHYATVRVENPSHYHPHSKPRVTKTAPVFSIPETKPNRTGIYVITIVKDEARYVVEWILYHLRMGVDHFLIFDNDSTDDLRQVLDRFVKEGVVTYFKWSTVKPNRQFNETIGNFTQEYPTKPSWYYQKSSFTYARYLLSRKNLEEGLGARWLLALDVDEFVAAEDSTSTLSDYVNRWESSAQYDQIGCVLIPWRSYSSSGNFYRPEGSVIGSYDRKCTFDSNQRFKSACLLDRVDVYLMSHYASMRKGYKMFNSDLSYRFDSVDPFFWGTVIKQGNLYVAHYFTRSFEDFVEKKRKSTNTRDAMNAFNIESFFSFHWGCWPTEKTSEVYARFLL